MGGKLTLRPLAMCAPKALWLLAQNPANAKRSYTRKREQNRQKQQKCAELICGNLIYHRMVLSV
jgi:hypothetical protein